MTLRMPDVPPQKGFRFIGAAEHQLRQSLATDIRGTIKALLTSTPVPGYQQMLYKFLAVIEPADPPDYSRIPYQSKQANDTHGTRIGCVYARLAHAMRDYYDLCGGVADISAACHIRSHLSDLREWAAAGIDHCRIMGGVSSGFWLEAP